MKRRDVLVHTKTRNALAYQELWQPKRQMRATATKTKNNENAHWGQERRKTMIKTISISTLFAALVLSVVAAVVPAQAEEAAAQAATQAAATVTYTGTFTGKSDHVTKGGVQIVTVDGKRLLVLAEDFSLDGAPDPKIGFGKDGYVKGTLFTKLGNLNGKQTYEIPTNVNLADFNEVWVWCEKFDVPLGVAKLTSAS